MSSRWFTEIRERRGLAYYVSPATNTYKESGYLAVRAGTKAETAQQVIDLAQKEFSNLKKIQISSTELKKAKEYIKGHLFLRYENSFEVADFYAEDLLMEGKLRSLDQLLKSIDAITTNDIKRLAGKLFVEKARNLAVIGIKEKLII